MEPHLCLIRALDAFQDADLSDFDHMDVWSTPPESPAGEQNLNQDAPSEVNVGVSC